MACSCHGKAGVAQNGRMKPDEPCTMCAYKHLEMALSAYSELSYEIDNREYVAGQLRLSVEHLKFEHREIALSIRDLAVTLEMAKDSNRQTFSEGLGNALKIVRDLMFNDHADILTRLKAIPQAHGRFKPDVIIPLGDGSKVDNAELRILLRSIDTNLKDYGKVYLVTHKVPEWINRETVEVVDFIDRHAQNKDANLHEKTLYAIEKYGIKYFLWCADDNAIMQPVVACEIPVLVNGKRRADFENAGGRWQKRVKATFDFAESRGVHLEHHFEVHCPQLFDGGKLLEAMQDVDYVSLPGLVIYTTWRVLTDTCYDALPQNDYKLTLETETEESIKELKDSTLQSRMFIGYNDSAIESGLIGRLSRIFQNKSKFEV